MAQKTHKNMQMKPQFFQPPALLSFQLAPELLVMRLLSILLFPANIYDFGR